LSKITEKTKREVTYWSYAAWSLPFAALALIIFSYFIGYETLLDKSLVLITTLFFGTSVFWWWWALHKLLYIIKSMEETAIHLGLVKKDITDVKEDIRKRDSDRKRRKS
jgi:hypothetical protein